MSKSKPIYGWWFSSGDTLPNGDGRTIKLRSSHTVKGRIVPCKWGLHASPTVYDALQYASSSILYRVRLSGVVVPHGKPLDKFAASKRYYIERLDAEPILREFARKCALGVIHLWDAPPVVKDYLKTGDEAAWAAAREAARAAAWDAEWDALWAAEWDAAWAAARAAVEAVRAAGRTAGRAAEWDAAWAAARAAEEAVVAAGRTAARADNIVAINKALLDELCISALKKQKRKKSRR